MNHYNWLEANFQEFAKKVGIEIDYVRGLLSAHGDKCYGYKSAWEKAGIPFEHGVAIYLLSYFSPFESTVRNTDNGWVDVKQWVIDNYPTFKQHLPSVGE